MSNDDSVTERVYDVPDSCVAKKCEVRQEVVELSEEFYLSEDEEIIETQIGDDGWVTLWIMKQDERKRVWTVDDEMVENY